MEAWLITLHSLLDTSVHRTSSPWSLRPPASSWWPPCPLAKPRNCCRSSFQCFRRPQSPVMGRWLGFWLCLGFPKVWGQHLGAWNRAEFTCQTGKESACGQRNVPKKMGIACHPPISEHLHGCRCGPRSSRVSYSVSVNPVPPFSSPSYR